MSKTHFGHTNCVHDWADYDNVDWCRECGALRVSRAKGEGEVDTIYLPLGAWNRPGTFRDGQSHDNNLN